MTRIDQEPKMPKTCGGSKISKTIKNIQIQFTNIVSRVVLILMRKYRMDRLNAEDAVQDTFLKLIMYAKDNRDHPVLNTSDSGMFFAYVLRSSINNCSSVMRREKTLERHYNIFLDIVDERAMQDERYPSGDRVKLLRQAIDKLPDPYNPIFSMLLKDGLSLAEIAQKLNIKKGTIYTQFQRGLERLRHLIGTA